MYIYSTHFYPLVICCIAIENDQRNSEFFPFKEGRSFQFAFCTGLPDGRSPQLGINRPAGPAMGHVTGRLSHHP